MYEYWNNLTENDDVCAALTEVYKNQPDEYKMQFLLDCGAVPQVIKAVQQHGPQVSNLLFKLTRTFCYSVHRDRLKQLGLWC